VAFVGNFRLYDLSVNKSPCFRSKYHYWNRSSNNFLSTCFVPLKSNPLGVSIFTTNMALTATITQMFPVTVHSDPSRPKRGRGVYAARDLQPGDVVLSCMPAAKFVTEPTRCAYCMSRGAAAASAGDGGASGLAPMLRCKVCRTSYCSKACQIADWADHKRECRALGVLQASLGDRLPEALLLARVLRGAALAPEPGPGAARRAAGGVLQHVPSDIDELAPGAAASTDAEEAAAADKVVALCRANGLLPATAAEAGGSEGSEAARARAVLASFGPTSFHITDAICVARGVSGGHLLWGSGCSDTRGVRVCACVCVQVGVYPAGALLNHSCAPNCAVAYAPLSTALAAATGDPAAEPTADRIPSWLPEVPCVQVRCGRRKLYFGLFASYQEDGRASYFCADHPGNSTCPSGHGAVPLIHPRHQAGKPGPPCVSGAASLTCLCVHRWRSVARL
jgi:hypothetical protein